MLDRAALPVLVAAIAQACSGAPAAAPSPVGPRVGTVAAATAAQPRALPGWLDPELVGTLIRIDAQGWVQRWDGGPFHHCLGPGVDRDVVDGAIAEMSSLSGIPTTDAGPCNVDWVRDYSVGHSVTVTHGTSRAILYAQVTLHHDDIATARHEGGHVLGFGHSPRPLDLMNATPRVETFSAEERAVLAWIYGR
jgi:hypothetical protein